MSEIQTPSEYTEITILPDYENNLEIIKFRKYLRIPSVVADDYDYKPCVDFLVSEAEKLELGIQLYYPGGPTKPILVLEWTGTLPELPAIVLNSHMDVVPVSEESWVHPPFTADIDEDGHIHGSGAQDMKCSGMQYLAAIRALKNDEIKLKRTILVMFVPDEENSGKYGMRPFVKTHEFKKLKIGFFFDEGAPTAGDVFNVYFAERAVWQLRFKISGTPGHGALLLKDTAGEKLRYLLDKFMEYRAGEVKRLEKDPSLTIGDVTSINATILNGGGYNNVLPSEIILCLDCRLAVLVNHIKFETMIRKWMEEAGGGIELIFDYKGTNVLPTVLDKNPIWKGFKTAMAQLQCKINVGVSAGATDSRFVRKKGIPAIGFTAINRTPPYLHGNDEYVSAEMYLQGIEIWKNIILSVGNVQC